MPRLISRLAAQLDRVPRSAWLVLGAGAIAAGFAAGLRLERDSWVAAPAPIAAAATGSLRGYDVRLADGSVVPLAPPGEATVVMVSSLTCGYCASAMRDFARLAEGRPLPRLRIVTLEGAADGARMIAQHGLAGTWHAGPADGSGELLLTFQFPGTPTFLLVDEGGAVRAALPGYPGAAAIDPWFRVMTGERSSLTAGPT